MLSIQWLKTPEYYLDQSTADYYFAGGEPLGQWYGDGAAALGFTGTVMPEPLRALFKGLTVDGRSLVQLQAGKPHQAAWDLTFSAPKSFSVLWSAANRRLRCALQRIHKRAVKKAIRYIQKVAAYTRRGKGGRILEVANLVFALFDHCTSRELDPQVHTHAVLLNVCTRSSDQSTGTILSKTIYDHKLAGGAVYQAALAQGVKRLGYRVRRTKDAFEIVGIPEALCQEQSKRRKAIEQLLGDKGLHTAKAAQIANLATRKAKRIPPREQLFAAWQQTNEQHGLTQEVVNKLADRRRRKRKIGLAKRGAMRGKEPAKAALASIVAEAIKTLSDKESHFSARELYREAIRESLETGIDPEVIRSAVQEQLDTNLVNVGRRDGYLRFSTQVNLALERRLLANIEQLGKHHRHCVDPGIVARHIDRRLPLGPELDEIELARNREQRNAVEQVTVRPGAVQVLVGMAGTGKTFTLGVANEIWSELGKRVRGFALAGAAARRLEEGSGIKSDTLAMFLVKLGYAREVHDLVRGTKTYLLPPTSKHPGGEVLLDRSYVIVIDEAAMCSSRPLSRVVEAVQAAGAKLVLVGDRRQLQPVDGPGGPMRAIEERAGKATLTVITRQHEHEHDPRPHWQREAVHHFADGNSVDGLLLLAERGKVSVLEDREAAKIALVRDWTAQSIDRPREHLVLAPTNADVADLNELCQLARKQRGLIGEKYIKVGDETIHVGDRVLCTRRSRALNLKIENGDFGAVLDIDTQRRIVLLQLDRGPIVQVPVKEYPHLQRGYCSTVHKAQGLSIERTSVLVGGSMENLHQSYVEASRHKDECRLYTSRWEAGQLLEELAIQMARTREKDLALDVLHENKHRPQTSDYFELPDAAPHHERLALEKLERLRSVLIPDAPEIRPPQKTKEEIQVLVERLREQVLQSRKQSQELPEPKPDIQTEIRPRIQPGLRL